MPDFELNPDQNPDAECRTGLETTMEFITSSGAAKSFSKKNKGGQNFGYYDLPSPKSSNLFRLTVKTKSGTAEGGSTEGRSDRVRVQFMQPNSALVAQKTVEILQASDNPEELLADEAALQEKLLEVISPEQMFLLVRAETFNTGPDGTAVKDFDIPNNWLPAPIFVFVTYAYDFESEWKTQQLGSEEEILDAAQLAIELLLIPIIPGFWADIGLMLILDGPELWELLKGIAGVPMGGENRHGCEFPYDSYLQTTYVIDYKSNLENLEGLMSTSQSDYLEALLAEDEAAARRGQLLIGTIIGAGILGILAASMGGDSVGSQ